MVCYRNISRFQIVLSLLLISSLIPSKAQESKVVVNLKSLPEPLFPDFPESQGKSGDGDFCTYYLGCVKFQTDEQPDIAVSLLTEFFVYTRYVTRQSIPWKEGVVNCLPHTDMDICKEYAFDLNDILNSGFDMSKRTVIITSGFYSKAQTDWQLEMSKRWLEVEDMNVIIVAWPGGNSNGRKWLDYKKAVANTRIVARQISILLYYFGKLNGNITVTEDEDFLSRIHLVGHSLGAHISGFVGKDFEGSIGRITGLDPAGPRFNAKERAMKLDRRDAKLVDCFHSNAGRGALGRLGHEKPLCHLDYYVNGGVKQPCCQFFNFPCSHKMINPLFIDMLRRQTEFKSDNETSFETFDAFVADSYDSFKHGKSFDDYCPKFARPETVDDLILGNDYEKCSLPMDLLSPYQKYKSLLETKYNNLIDLNSTMDAVNQTYFESSAREFYASALLRMKYPNFQNHTKNMNAYEKNQFHISIQQDYSKNGFNTSLSKYDMIPDASGFDILAPIQLPYFPISLLSHFMRNKFYMDRDNNYADLISVVKEIFPISITIRNLAKKLTIDNFVPFTKRVTLTPLRNANRSLIISYHYLKPINNTIPVYALKGDEGPLQPLLDFVADVENQHELTFYMNKIIIGPERLSR